MESARSLTLPTAAPRLGALACGTARSASNANPAVANAATVASTGGKRLRDALRPREQPEQGDPLVPAREGAADQHWAARRQDPSKLEGAAG